MYVQITAFTVLGQLHYSATVCEHAGMEKVWHHVVLGITDLGLLDASNPHDLVWAAAQSVIDDLTPSSSSGSPF